MNKLIATLLGIATLSAALPAIAGPDWNVIERGRAAARTQAAKPCAQTTSVSKLVPQARARTS